MESPLKRGPDECEQAIYLFRQFRFMHSEVRVKVSTKSPRAFEAKALATSDLDTDSASWSMMMYSYSNVVSASTVMPVTLMILCSLVLHVCFTRSTEHSSEPPLPSIRLWIGLLAYSLRSEDLAPCGLGQTPLA